MIDNATLKVLHRQVTDLLLNYQLSEGLDGISLVTRECADQQQSRALESLTLSYHQMLDFLEQGGHDAQRGQIQDNLQREAFRILNSAARQIRLERADDNYGKAYKRLFLDFGNAAAEMLCDEWNRLQGTAEKYDTQDLLFDLLWTMPLWDAKDTAEWFEFISRQDNLVQQHFTGAVFLSCWEYPDTEKITFLRLMADSENEQVYSLSITLLTLVLLRFERLLSIYPSLPLNLHSKRLNEAFCQVQKELILMRESPRINQEMSKFVSALNPNGPNFDEEMKRSMRKLTEYVSIGYDMDLAKISLLNSSKFLKTISHWWAPFDESRPMIQEFFTRQDGDLAQGIRNLIGHSTECSLNRYALCELMSEHFDMGKIENRLTELFQAMGRLSEIGPQPGLAIRNHVQNLYRFFHYSPLSKELENPFEASLILPDNHYLRARFSKKHFLELCELLTKVGDTDTALRFLQEIVPREGATANVLRMMGLCYKMKKDMHRAVQMFSQADMLEEDHPWTLAQLADCYAQIERLPELVEVLRRLESQSPDNLYITLQIADSLSKMNRLDEALNQLYKAELAQPDNTETITRIMLCSARLGKFEVADKYLARLTQANKNWDAQTHLLAGDVYLLKGEWNQAVEEYNQAGKDNFKKHMQQILSLGITEKDLALIKDIIERR